MSTELSAMGVELLNGEELPEAAENWRKRLLEFCELQTPDDRASRQAARQGELPWLLLTRRDPAVVFTTKEVLKLHVDRESEKDEGFREALSDDAFLYFVMDKSGLGYAAELGVNALPWNCLNQLQFIERLTLFERTSCIKGFSEATLNVRKRIVRSADTKDKQSMRSHVMVLGESGVGKERVAQAMWKAAELPADKCEAIACGMLGTTTLLDKICGHWSDAYTGAHTSVPGALERLSGGSLLLDDLDSAESPKMIQGALLRFLSTSPPVIQRLGHPPKKSAPIEDDCRGTGAEPANPPKKQAIRIDREARTWLIVTTNRNPREMVEGELMREDFLFRFRRFIQVPPLRSRKHDIPQIAMALWEDLNHQRPLDLPALRWLRDRPRDWRGNVREIQTLLICGADILSENTMLSWRKAFEQVAGSTDDYLMWFDQPPKQRELHPPAPQPSSGLSNLWGHLEKDNEKDVETIWQIFTDTFSCYQKCEDIKRDLEESVNPAAMNLCKTLLYLKDRNSKKTKHADVERVLGKAWATTNAVLKTLITKGLVAWEQGDGGAVYSLAEKLRE